MSDEIDPVDESLLPTKQELDQLSKAGSSAIKSRLAEDERSWQAAEDLNRDRIENPVKYMANPEAHFAKMGEYIARNTPPPARHPLAVAARDKAYREDGLFQTRQQNIKAEHKTRDENIRREHREDNRDATREHRTVRPASASERLAAIESARSAPKQDRARDDTDRER